MTQEEAKKKYLEYLEGHIGNVREAFDLLCSLDIPFINENKDKLQTIIDNHDKSKYDEPEWTAYLHHFYPTCDEDSLKTEEFEEACRHHINQNPHHWDYWMSEGELREDIDELEYKLYTVERLCDHMAMSIQNDNSPADWYFANKECIKMPDYGYDLYEELLEALPKDYDLSFHGTRTDGKPERETVNEDAIDDYIKSLEIDEDSILNNYKTQISNHYKYIRQVGRKINKAKYDVERNRLKKKQDFYKEVYKRLKSLKEELGLNDKVVLRLGKRVKRSKTSNAIEIDTQMTNHDKQLKESSSIIYGYRSISKNEFFKLLDGETIKGTFDNSQEKQTTSNAANVVAFYKNKYRWKDARHVFFIKCKFNESDIVDTGIGTYYASKDFAKTKVWTGRRGNTEYQLDEFYVSEYNLDNVVAFDYEALSLFNDDYQKMFTDSLTQKGIPALTESVELENLVCNALRKDGEEYLEKTTLTEMKLSQIKQKSRNQDPERINRSKKVKTTYIGMSKFGILNFKTTSQSRNGHHYQTVEFKDMTPFEEIIKSGAKVMPADVKKQLQEQDVNVWCTDESWAYWAWAHQAYKNDFLYIDDRIPNLKKAIQAPKVNNVRLNGGACKHILSVIDYCTRPFVLLAISDDMNKFLAGTQDDKMQKQTVATQNQYDMVANWDWSDIEEITGLSRIQIISDISKTLQVVPKASQGDIITDIVGEALPQEDQGVKREIVNRVEELIKEE
jgi:hypothetical protein